MRPIRGLLAAALLAGLAPALASCSGGTGDYCDAVRSHQTEISDAVARGGSTSLLRVLPALRDLQDKAPDDIADEWQQVVGRLTALRDALRDAGVDPAAYDAEDPPADVTKTEQDAITAAATELARPETQAALAAVQQQVRDVCQTPLSR